MRWQIPKIWSGEDVWIIGGGPSAMRQFDVPEELIQSVVKNGTPLSVYSNYFKPIHNKHIIGINVAYMIGDWIDMVFFGDSNFFLKQERGLSRFPNLKVSCHPNTDKVPWVKFLPHDKKHSKGISTNPKMVSWNQNSGAAAISVAAHAGAKRIILLGFDMSLDKQGGSHWHSVYRQGKKVIPPFQKHLKGFPEIAKDATRMGIEILNASPNSAIKCFRKVTVKEILCG